MAIDSLWKLCALLFVDAATLSVAATPVLLLAARHFVPWQAALAGGAASAAGSVVQFAILRAMLARPRPWMRRLLPARERIDAARRRYPSASFLAIAIARATPLPDAPLKLVAAAVRYPLRRYFLAVIVGAVPYTFALVLLGRAVRFPGWLIAAIAGVFLAGLAVDVLRRGRTHAAA